MEPLLGLLFGVVTFGFVSVFGLAYVDGGRMFLRRDRGSSQGEQRLVTAAGPAFEPLDLGEPPMKWPSQTSHPRRPLPLLPWPSETWTDDFFGRRGAKPPVSIAQAAAAAAAAPPATSAEDEFFGAAPETPKKTKPAKSAAKPPATKSAPARPPSSKPASGLPSDADIVAVVEQQGLAAAVERVRAATGWDFQQAAGHIAQVLRSRRGRS